MDAMSGRGELGDRGLVEDLYGLGERVDGGGRAGLGGEGRTGQTGRRADGADEADGAEGGV